MSTAESYLILNKINSDGETIGKWYISGIDSPIAAMQIVNDGNYNQHTLIYLRGGANVLMVKETPEEIISMEKKLHTANK